MKLNPKTWMKQAYRDLLAAEKSVYEHERGFAPMLARQASEKALTALYVKQFGKIPFYSHGVTELLQLLKLSELETRVSGELDSNSEVRSVNNAKKIIEFVEQRL